MNSGRDRTKRYKYDPESKVVVLKVCSEVLCTMRSLDAQGDPLPIPVGLFDRDNRSADGYGSYCRECKKRINRIAYYLRSEYMTEYMEALEEQQKMVADRLKKKEEEKELRRIKGLDAITAKRCCNPMCSSKLDGQGRLVNPDVQLPLEDFSRDRSRVDGHSVYCKICMRQRVKDSYNAIKDKKEAEAVHKLEERGYIYRGGGKQ